MSAETIELGSAPFGEACAQLGEPGYELRAHEECRALVGQLRRLAAARGVEVPATCRLRIKSNAHDFGLYYEVAVTFDPDDAAACDAAAWLEENFPEAWDAEALAELGRNPPMPAGDVDAVLGILLADDLRRQGGS